MLLKRRLGDLVKSAVFEGDPLPDRVFLAQMEPQQEVQVWLIGAGEPIDVTRRHCQASSMPFTLCLEFSRGRAPTESERGRLKLRFCAIGVQQRVLGEIGLRYRETFACGESQFLLFHSSSSVNYCLPWQRLWSHYLWDIHSHRKGGTNQAPAAQRRAMAVMFSCPRPVSLVSVADAGGNENISPVNVMGALNRIFFGFSLPHGDVPERSVQQTRRAVISSVPMREANIPYLLVPNRDKPAMDWRQMPLQTRPSQLFGLPAPTFASRIRELQVEQVHRLGFHTFFLARVVSDEQLARVPELCVAHGFYADWRVRNLGIDKMQADAEDLYVRAPSARD
jgi:flavin reductase (DIM6/NTAB) family NADH-FMN oxidoreductase RutF